MVHVVNGSSIYCPNYRELNQQLAKDNGELRQQLGQVINENSRHKEELHRKNVEILDLKRQINELNLVRTKFIAIKDIILDDSIRPIEGNSQNHTHHHHHHNRQTTSIHPVEESLRERGPLSLPSPLDQSAVNSSQLPPTVNPSESSFDSSASSCDTLSGGEEAEAYDSESDEGGLECIREEESISSLSASQAAASSLNSVDLGIEDSLCPPHVSMPTLQPERPVPTPSIYDCFDTMGPPSVEDQDSKQQNEVEGAQEDAGKEVDKEITVLAAKEKEIEESQSPLPPPSPIASGSSTGAGLRVSNNNNATSPIHPIAWKSHFNISTHGMFQSTPVQKNAATKNLEAELRNSDNQENVVSAAKETVVTNKQPARKGKGSKRQPVMREVTYGDEEPKQSRYNLRKRTKV